MTSRKDPERNETKKLHEYADFAGRRVLEVGCGEGRLTWQYAAEARSTIGIDLDADALRVATIDRPSDLAGRIHFSLARSEHLPFSKEKFDIALLAWSL
jgi:ubiquinone/menaquinone biosynthesis C-methylase UbiE